MTACISASVPSPDGAEIPNTGPVQRSAGDDLGHPAALLFRQQIQLVQHQPAFPFGQFGAVRLKFA
jgi:hypothetical protein